jgi:UDP-N-acetylmuramyl pentapeptide synthase
MPADAIHRYADARAASNGVSEWLRRGDLVLLKASRTMHLEMVAQTIAENRTARGVRKAAS